MRSCCVADSLDQVTPLILTYNEEANIARSLAGLAWARRIVVVDSASTDRTLEILAAHSQVEVVQRSFDNHASQWNYGVDHINTEWVLCLDADYRVTTKLGAEILTFLQESHPSIDGVIIPFRYLIYGKPLQASVYPAKVVMFRPSRCRYINDGHTQLLKPKGPTATLHEPILHDDRKPLSRWLWSQQRYAALEVAKLLSSNRKQLRLVDRLRLLQVITPFATPIYCLLWRRGLLDGWRGWFYAFQRAYAEILLSLMLWEARHGQ